MINLKPWSKYEKNKLKKMNKNNVPLDRQVALFIHDKKCENRSPAAITYKREAMGLKFDK